MPDDEVIPAVPAPAGPTRDYPEVWAHAALAVIHQLTENSTWEIAPDPASASDEPLEIVAHIELLGDLAGIQQLRFNRASVRAWAQLMLPPSGEAVRQRAVPIDDAERDALTELVRRLLSAVAQELRASGWGESKVALRHLGPLRRTVENSEKSQLLRFRHPSGQTLDLDMAFDRTLREHIHHRLHPDDPPPARPGEAREAGVGAAKMDLLLDVELDVTLRFGGRQMLLHDVCELAPGSVLELDRHIDDPVELMVGNKIIAWGEVVVVDGNYGVRVNRLVHRRERMAAMEAVR
jgi:flagellar motor switch protein FliN/FliY